MLLSLAVPISLGLAAWAALKLPVFSAGRVLEQQPLERMDPASAVVFVGFAAVSGVLAAVVLTVRLRAARCAFRGIVVSGRITKITEFKDRAYLHFRFAHDSREFDMWRFVHQTEEVKALQEGQEVRVALDPKRPQGAWVVELFECCVPK